MSVAGSRRTAEGALEAKDAADDNDDDDEDEDDNDDDAEVEDDGEEGRRIGSVGGADAVAIARSLDTRPRTSAVISRSGDVPFSRMFATTVPKGTRPERALAAAASPSPWLPAAWAMPRPCP
jgi:hypothetical protein